MLEIEHCFLYGTIILAAFLIYYAVKGRSIKYMIRFAVLWTYFNCVIAVTMFPLPIDPAHKEYMSNIWYNLIPFKVISETLKSGNIINIMLQICGQALMAFPYGVYIGSRKRRVTEYAGYSILFPAVIETAQLLYGVITGIYYRCFDVDDFILNSAGSILGILCSRIIANTKTGKRILEWLVNMSQ